MAKAWRRKGIRPRHVIISPQDGLLEMKRFVIEMVQGFGPLGQEQVRTEG
jgi:hypothetical protein